jgi:hypothetical protein
MHSTRTCSDSERKVKEKDSAFIHEPTTIPGWRGGRLERGRFGRLRGASRANRDADASETGSAGRAD